MMQEERIGCEILGESESGSSSAGHTWAAAAVSSHLSSSRPPTLSWKQVASVGPNTTMALQSSKNRSPCFISCFFSCFCPACLPPPAHLISPSCASQVDLPSWLAPQPALAASKLTTYNSLPALTSQEPKRRRELNWMRGWATSNTSTPTPSTWSGWREGARWLRSKTSRPGLLCLMEPRLLLLLLFLHPASCSAGQGLTWSARSRGHNLPASDIF